MCQKISIERAVRELDEIDITDPERAHGDADAALVRLVPHEARDAYNSLADRCAWWAYA